MDHVWRAPPCDACGRSAETALPQPSMGDCDRILLHVLRMRRHRGHWGQEGSCGALWGMWSEPLHNSAGRYATARWAEFGGFVCGSLRLIGLRRSGRCSALVSGLRMIL
eukprot:4379336-Prymnesium_polylepis.2